MLLTKLGTFGTRAFNLIGPRVTSSKPFLFLLWRLSTTPAADIPGRYKRADELAWLSYCIANVEESDAQLRQDLWVIYRTQGLRSGYFVEVGACEPQRLSNTYLLEWKYEWRGLLIEPNPAMATKLRAMRKSEVLQIGVGNGGTTELLISEDPEFSTTSSNDGTAKHSMLKESGQRVTVTLQTLREVFTEQSAPADIDYLSVDIEGAELTALQSNDWARFSPKMISVEHNFREDRQRIQDYLFAQGYVLDPLNNSLSWDDWFIRPDVLAASTSREKAAQSTRA